VTIARNLSATRRPRDNPVLSKATGMTHQTSWPAMAVLVSLGLLAGGCMSNAPPSEASLTGTATYRERIALPADAVFEATLEDVTRADAPAEVIGRTRMDSPGNPPFKFEIAYDPARIDQSHRYTVRAKITHGARLMFATDTHYPGVERGTTRPRGHADAHAAPDGADGIDRGAGKHLLEAGSSRRHGRHRG